MSMQKETISYKHTEGCQIKADIYLCGIRNSPVIILIHGGALIWGSRNDMRPDQIELYVNAGYNVVCVDYRLAPETKLIHIAEDICDAIRWVKSAGSAKNHFNPEKMAVIGHSAGGYLSLMTGTFSQQDRPNAIISFYGYGDITGDWYCKPSSHYCREPLVNRAEAYGSIGGKVISEGNGNRFKYYLYCRQNGIWTSEVSGLDLALDGERLRRYCPYYEADKDFPPALFLHGDEDTDVPYEQSVMMSQKLDECGVANKLIAMKGMGHVFDWRMDDVNVAAAFDEVLRFLKWDPK